MEIHHKLSLSLSRATLLRRSLTAAARRAPKLALLALFLTSGLLAAVNFAPNAAQAATNNNAAGEAREFEVGYCGDVNWKFEGGYTTAVPKESCLEFDLNGTVYKFDIVGVNNTNKANQGLGACANNAISGSDCPAHSLFILYSKANDTQTSSLWQDCKMENGYHGMCTSNNIDMYFDVITGNRDYQSHGYIDSAIRSHIYNNTPYQSGKYINGQGSVSNVSMNSALIPRDIWQKPGKQNLAVCNNTNHTGCLKTAKTINEGNGVSWDNYFWLPSTAEAYQIKDTSQALGNSWHDGGLEMPWTALRSAGAWEHKCPMTAESHCFGESEEDKDKSVDGTWFDIAYYTDAGNIKAEGQSSFSTLYTVRPAAYVDYTKLVDYSQDMTLGNERENTPTISFDAATEKLTGFTPNEDYAVYIDSQTDDISANISGIIYGCPNDLNIDNGESVRSFRPTESSVSIPEDWQRKLENIRYSEENPSIKYIKFRKCGIDNGIVPFYMTRTSAWTSSPVQVNLERLTPPKNPTHFAYADSGFSDVGGTVYFKTSGLEYKVITPVSGEATIVCPADSDNDGWTAVGNGDEVSPDIGQAVCVRFANTLLRLRSESGPRVLITGTAGAKASDWTAPTPIAERTGSLNVKAVDVDADGNTWGTLGVCAIPLVGYCFPDHVPLLDGATPIQPRNLTYLDVYFKSDSVDSLGSLTFTLTGDDAAAFSLSHTDGSNLTSDTWTGTLAKSANNGADNYVRIPLSFNKNFLRGENYLQTRLNISSDSEDVAGLSIDLGRHVFYDLATHETPPDLAIDSENNTMTGFVAGAKYQIIEFGYKNDGTYAGISQIADCVGTGDLAPFTPVSNSLSLAGAGMTWSVETHYHFKYTDIANAVSFKHMISKCGTGDKGESSWVQMDWSTAAIPTQSPTGVTPAVPTQIYDSFSTGVSADYGLPYQKTRITVFNNDHYMYGLLEEGDDCSTVNEWFDVPANSAGALIDTTGATTLCAKRVGGAMVKDSPVLAIPILEAPAIGICDSCAVLVKRIDNAIRGSSSGPFKWSAPSGNATFSFATGRPDQPNTQNVPMNFALLTNSAPKFATGYDVWLSGDDADKFDLEYVQKTVNWNDVNGTAYLNPNGYIRPKEYLPVGTWIATVNIRAYPGGAETATTQVKITIAKGESEAPEIVANPEENVGANLLSLNVVSENDGGEFTVTSLTPDVCDFSDEDETEGVGSKLRSDSTFTLKLTDYGECKVQSSQNENDNYASSATSQWTFDINKVEFDIGVSADPKDVESTQFLLNSAQIRMPWAPEVPTGAMMYGWCSDGFTCGDENVWFSYQISDEIDDDDSVFTSNFRWLTPSASLFTAQPSIFADEDLGSIAGVGSDFEWAVLSGSSCADLTAWTQGSGSVTGVSGLGATYCIRQKAVEGIFASEFVEVQVGPGAPQLAIDYNSARLTGLDAGVSYAINVGSAESNACPSAFGEGDATGTLTLGALSGGGESAGSAAIDADWFDQSLTIVRCADSEGALDSSAGALYVPELSRALSVSAPTFWVEAVGYSPRPAAAALTIANPGIWGVAVSGVSVNGADFDVNTDGTAGVAPGSQNLTWTVQPKIGLAVGIHTAVVTVTYNGTMATTVTANVSFEVEAYKDVVIGGGGSDGGGSDGGGDGGLVISVPGESTVDPDGDGPGQVTVTLPTSEPEYEVKIGDVEAIVPGGSIIHSDGSISMPESGGPFEVELPDGEGGTVRRDGVPDGARISTRASGLESIALTLMMGDQNNAHRGDEFLVEGEGFIPGEVVRVELHSDPIFLGTKTVDASGKFTFALADGAAIPVDAVDGLHDVVALDHNNPAVLHASDWVRVTTPAAPGSDDDANADALNAALAASALSKTGTPIAPFALLLASLLSVGAILARQRRRI